MKNTKILPVLCLIAALMLTLCGGALSEADEKIRPSVVIMSMFEVDALAGDFPGEAQFFYEEYFSDPEIYTIVQDPFGCSLYVENDMALCLLGQGKSTAAINVATLLNDPRFDFSDTFFLLTGCAGSAEDYGVAGDVYIITATLDYDLGHSADPREFADENAAQWYRAPEYDCIAYLPTDPALSERAYALTGDLKLETTDDARACMARNFGSADWAVRDPQVLKGTSVTSDDYWKGEYKHQRAVYMTEAYQAPDPYAATDMEDAAVALAFAKKEMRDQLMITRCSVNMDVFLDGDTPASLWGNGDKLFDNGFDGFTDIFSVAMENSFKVGRAIIEDVRENGL